MVCAVVATLAWLFIAGARRAGSSANLAENSSGAEDTAGGCDKRCRSVESRRARALGDKMLSITNRYRKENKMEALAPNENLGRVADEQATYMCTKGVLTHDSPGGGLREKMEKNNFRAVNIGENIAKQENADYREVARLWEKSGEHRKNILGDFVYSNVSTCLDRAGNRYWVQVFGKNMPNREIPEIEEIQKLKEYLEKGFSGVENGRYIIMLKPGAEDRQDGGKQDSFGGFQPMDKEEQTRITKKLEGLFRPTRPSRKEESPGHNIVDADEDGCEGAGDCAPEKTVRSRVFNTDAGYSQAVTIPYFRSSSAEKIPKFIFGTSTTGHDPEKNFSEVSISSQTQRPGLCSSADDATGRSTSSQGSTPSVSPLIIIKTTTNTIYRTITKTSEAASSTVAPETNTASSSDIRSSDSTGSADKSTPPTTSKSKASPETSSTALHADTASSLEPPRVNVAEDILSGKYPKTYDNRHPGKPVGPKDATPDRAPSPRDEAGDAEPSKLFAEYFEDLKKLILTAIRKDSSAAQDRSTSSGSVWPLSRSLSEWRSKSVSTSRIPPSENGHSGSLNSEGQPSDNNDSAIFAKLSTLLMRTSPRAADSTESSLGTAESASALPKTVSFSMDSVPKSCSPTDRRCMEQQPGPRSGSTVSKDEVVRVIRELLRENEFKIRILKDGKGSDGRSGIEIARPLLN